MLTPHFWWLDHQFWWLNQHVFCRTLQLLMVKWLLHVWIHRGTNHLVPLTVFGEKGRDLCNEEQIYGMSVFPVKYRYDQLNSGI